MIMNDYLETSWKGKEDGAEPVEDITGEVRRIWINELKPHFDTEREFLLKHGVPSGYDRPYITKVLEDHWLMEKLVWSSGEENVRKFTRLLAAHIRFKQDYFAYRVGTILGQGQESDSDVTQ